MKKFILILVSAYFLLLNTLAGQINNSQNNITAQDTINPGNFDNNLLSELIIKEMNMMMDSLNLVRFTKDDFLAKIAGKHAEEMAFNGRATTKGDGKKENISERIKYHGGSGTGDEFVSGYRISSSEGYLTYADVARGIIIKWTSRNRNIKKLMRQRFYHAGAGCQINDDKVYTSFFMGNYFTENKGSERAKTLDPEITSDSFFIFWKWGMEKYNYRACKKCKRYFPDLADLQQGLEINETGEIIFSYDDLRMFKRLIRRDKDGLAVDIVRNNQFNNCKQNNAVDYSLVNKGIMTKPVYSKKLNRNNLASKERRRRQKLKIILGEFPENIESENTELNLMIIKDKHVCYNIPPSFNFNPDFDFDQKLKMLPDTIIPKGVPSYTPETTSKTISFKIPFEKNKYTYNYKDIAPLMEALNEPEFYINKINVTAFSSIEGNKKVNKSLQTKRAQSIVNALEKNRNKKFINSVKTKSNWEDFKSDIKESNYPKLSEMTKNEILNYIEKNNLSKKLENILKNHRYAEVKLWITYNISGDNEEEFVYRQFKNAIDSVNLNKALAIQKYIFDKIASKKYSAEPLKEINIPLNKKFTGIKMNNLCIFKSEFNNISDSVYREKIRKLWELDKENPYIFYNLVLMNTKLLDPGNEYERENLQEDINYMYDLRLSKKKVDRLNIELQYRKIEHFSEIDIIESSLDKLKEILDEEKTSRKNALQLSSLFIKYGNYQFSYDLLKPYITDKNASDELLLTFISAGTKLRNKIHSPNISAALKRIKNRDNSLFCDLFKGDNKISIQFFENDKIKELYCNSCNK